MKSKSVSLKLLYSLAMVGLLGVGTYIGSEIFPSDGVDKDPVVNFIDSRSTNNEFSKDYVFETKPLDSLGRATEAHIFLNVQDLPSEAREPRINFNPFGWRNFKATYKKSDGSTGEYWVFNRGHLIGYLFCGLNDEPTNLIIQTEWSNKGGYQRIDRSNKESMIYYEMGLRDWLESNRTMYLDYTVTALYEGKEMIPRKIKLKYAGTDGNKQPVIINLDSEKENISKDSTEVILENIDPNIEIEYTTLEVISSIKHSIKEDVINCRIV